MSLHETMGEIPEAVQAAIATSEAMGAPPFEPTVTATLNPGVGFDKMNHAPILVRTGHLDVDVIEKAAAFMEAGFTVYLSFEAEADFRRFRQLWIKVNGA